MTNLVDLNEDAMGHILEHCNFLDVQILRRACGALRDHITKFPPKSSISEIRVTVNDGSIFLNLGAQLNVEYQDIFGGCRVVAEKLDLPVEASVKEGQNSMELFINDFKTVMEYQRQTFLDDFKILTGEDHLVPSEEACMQVMAGIQDILPTSPIKTKKLFIKVWNEAQILQVLPHFHTNSLEELVLESVQDPVTMAWLEINDYLETNTWDNLKVIKVDAVMRRPVFHFLHCDRVDLMCYKLVRNDIQQIKEALLASPSLHKVFVIHFQSAFPRLPRLENHVLNESRYRVDNSELELVLTFFYHRLEFRFVSRPNNRVQLPVA